MCWLTDPQYSSGNSLISQTGNAVGSGLNSIGSGLNSVAEGLGNTLNAIAKNPLPTLEAVALTYVLEDPQFLALDSTTAAAIATTATQYANGNHNINSLLLNLGASIGGSMIGQYAGQEAANLTPVQASYENSLTGEVTSQAGLSASTVNMIKTVVTSASGAAATVALKGGDLNQVLTAGVSGAVTSSINAELKSQGIQNAPAQLIANATTAATKAILSGKDVGTAVGSSVAATAIQQTISAGVNSIVNRQNNLSSLNDQYTKTATQFNDWVSSTLEPVENVLNLGPALQSQYSSIENQINQLNNVISIANNPSSATASQLSAAGINQFGAAARAASNLPPLYSLPDGTVMTGINTSVLNTYVNNQYTTLQASSSALEQNVTAYNNAYTNYTQNLEPILTNYQNQLSTIQNNITNESSALNTDIQNVSTAVVNYEQQVTNDTTGIISSVVSDAAKDVPAALDSAAQTQGFTDFAQLQKAQSEGFDPTDGQTYNQAVNLGYSDASTYSEAQQVHPGITADEFSNLQSYAQNAGFGNDLANAYSGQQGGFNNSSDYNTAKSLDITTYSGLQNLQSYAQNAGFGANLATAQDAQKNGFTNQSDYSTAQGLDLKTNTQLQDLKTFASDGQFSDLKTAQTAQNEGFNDQNTYQTAVSEGFSSGKDYALALSLGITTQSGLSSLQKFADSGNFGTDLSGAQAAQKLGIDNQDQYQGLLKFATNGNFGNDLITAQAAQKYGVDSQAAWNASNVDAQQAGWKNYAEQETAAKLGFTDPTTYNTAESLGIATQAAWDKANGDSQSAGWAGLVQEKAANQLGFTEASPIALAFTNAAIANQNSSTPGIQLAAGDSFRIDLSGVPNYAETKNPVFPNPLPPGTTLATSEQADNWETSGARYDPASNSWIMGSVNPSEAGSNTPISEVDVTYGILDGSLVNLTTGENLGDPSANGYKVNENGQWVSDSGVVAPEVTTPSGPTSPLAPGLDLSNLDITGLGGASSGIVNAMKGVSTIASSGNETGNTGTGTNTGGTSGVSGGTGGETGGTNTGTPGTIPSAPPTIPIVTPIKPVTAGGTGTGLTASQLAVLSTPTIFNPYIPGLMGNGPQVNLSGLAVQPVTEAVNTAGYMPDMPDMPDLPYDYGAPQDVQRVTYASPNEGETTTMAATGGSVDDLLRLMDWRS